MLRAGMEKVRENPFMPSFRFRGAKCISQKQGLRRRALLLKIVEARGVEPLLGQKESMVIHGSP